MFPAGMSVSPQTLERFQREARAASALNHPNICTIYDVGTDPPFIAMELLQGETLQQRLARGPLDVALVVDRPRWPMALTPRIVRHRASRHQAREHLSDGARAEDPRLRSGQSRALRTAIDASMPSTMAKSLTEPGSTVGTVAYMSPEQLRGEELDERTDLFSLGVVLYEMATGRAAFTGATGAVISARFCTPRR